MIAGNPPERRLDRLDRFWTRIQAATAGPELPAWPELGKLMSNMTTLVRGIPDFFTPNLHALRGPRDDWLDDLGALAATPWTASSRSDRVGMRLEGEPLKHDVSKKGKELPSEGVVRGSIQVPPGGEPVVFLADHPVTGGYPVVAVLVDGDIDQAAQAVPGQQIRIVLVGQSV